MSTEVNIVALLSEGRQLVFSLKWSNDPVHEGHLPGTIGEGERVVSLLLVPFEKGPCHDCGTESWTLTCHLVGD